MAHGPLRRAWGSASSRSRIIVGSGVSLFSLHVLLLSWFYLRSQQQIEGPAPTEIFDPYRGLLLFETPIWVVLLLLTPGVVVGSIAAILYPTKTDSKFQSRRRTLLFSVGLVLTLLALSLLLATFAVFSSYVALAFDPNVTGDRVGILLTGLFLGNIAAILFLIVGIWALLNLGAVILFSVVVGWGSGELLWRAWN